MAARLMPSISDIANREPRAPDIGTPEDWARIESALGFKDFELRRREKLWLYFPPFDPPDVRLANVRRALDALKRDAVRLFLDIEPTGLRQGPGDIGGKTTYEAMFLDVSRVCKPEEAPDDGLDELDRWALAYLSREILPWADRDALLKGLDKLIAAVDNSAEALPEDRGGRPTDWRLCGLIYELARLYSEYSGRKPGISRHPTTHRPGGPFLRFVSACLHTLEPKTTKSDEALAMLIQRTLKIRRWRAVVAG